TPPPHPAYRMTARISIPATLPPQKRPGIALGPRYEVGESSTTALLPLWIERSCVIHRERVGRIHEEFETRVRQDTEEIYMRLDDEQSERQLLAGRLNMLFRDRRAHAYTRHLMKTEAWMSREAWVRSTDASDLVHGQMTKIRELHAADRKRQTVISELLMTDHRRSTEITELRTALQAQVTALQGQADEEEEEEEHPAHADSVVVAPTAADQAPSVEETKPFETDESAATPPPHPAYRMTARISIPAPVPMPAWTDSEVARLLAIS
nr:hypothetical protein [Tanacetum cinerariifolium]